MFCGSIWGCLWPMLRLLGGWFHGLVVISLVDCFVGISYATTGVGISYATIGLEDQVVIA